jgi:hypothetical protein
MRQAVDGELVFNYLSPVSESSLELPEDLLRSGGIRAKEPPERIEGEMLDRGHGDRHGINPAG